MSDEKAALDTTTKHKLESLLALHAETTPLVPHAAATSHRNEDHVADYSGREKGGWTEHDTARALNGLPYDVYLGLKFYHEDPLPRIQQACAHSRSMFVDHEFPVHQPALVHITGNANNGAPKRLAPGILTSSNCRDFRKDGPKRAKCIRPFVIRAENMWVWIRGSSMKECALFHSSSRSIDPRNVLQGQVGNCGFCSSFASVAAGWPELLRGAFGHHSERCLSICGAISVRLFPKGRERYLLLDDYVLCRKDCSQSSPSLHSFLRNDLWIRLLEKVYVKVQGPYASLDGFYKYKSLYRHPARALQLLTGAPVAMEVHYKGQNVNDVYDTLLATQDTCARVAHCRQQVDGLYSNHGYSLLWVGEAAGVKLACLRNPHGHGSYTGKYGYGSKAWAETRDTLDRSVASDLLLLEYFEKCPDTGRVTWRRSGEKVSRRSTRTTRASARDDGIFFMEFSVFVDCFPITTMVGPMNPNGSRGLPTSSSFRDVPDCVYQINGKNLRHVKAILMAATTMGKA